MKKIDLYNFRKIAGGMKWEGGRESNNVIDLRGKDKGGWIDANSSCWKNGTSSSSMYPGGVYRPNVKF